MQIQMGPAQAREAAEELRFYREAMKVPAHVLASRLGWSPSKLSRVENGLAPLTEIDVARFTANCGGPADMVDSMLELCRAPGVPGYWLTKRLHSLVFHETTAVFSASYNPLVLPGLMQTEEYAAALIGSELNWLVPVRMERQTGAGQRAAVRVLHPRAGAPSAGGQQPCDE